MPCDVLTDRYSQVKEIVETNRLVCPNVVSLHTFMYPVLCLASCYYVPSGALSVVQGP